MLRKFFNFLLDSKTICFLAVVSIVSSFRTLFLPLHSDEVTYVNIATSLVNNGTYHLNGVSTTVIPVVPLVIAAISTLTNVETGIFLSRILQVLIALVGVYYAYKTVVKVTKEASIAIVLMLLVVVNTNFITAICSLYPDSILFCFLWVLLYYLSEDVTRLRTWIPILVSMVVLVMTRYLYAVMGLLVLLAFINYIIASKSKHSSQIMKLSLLIGMAIVPLAIWFYYVGNVESNQTNGISYFNRFKNHGLWYNIQAGVGLIKHDEVGKVNGIPAFASLFAPITGLRSWILSIPILFFAFYGYFKNKTVLKNTLLLTLIIIMSGFIFAGTGFSRYWLPLIPAYVLGFYLTLKEFKVSDYWFQLVAVGISIIYVINELRLDYMIFQKL